MVLFLLFLLGEPITDHILGHAMPGSRTKIGENLHIDHFWWFESEERIDFIPLSRMDGQGGGQGFVLVKQGAHLL